MSSTKSHILLYLLQLIIIIFKSVPHTMASAVMSSFRIALVQFSDLPPKPMIEIGESFVKDSLD